MPRKSLPPMVKELMTYNVCLTSTTEEQLWEHFCKSVDLFEEQMRRITDQLDSICSDIYEYNPYTKYDWRRGKPSRKYWDISEIHIMADDELEQYRRNIGFRFDLKRCNSAFEWEKDETKGSEVCRMEFIFQAPFDRIESLKEQIKIYDRHQYTKAENEWKERDKEWIEKKAKVSNHYSNHHPKQYYIDLFNKDPTARWFYKDTIPDEEDTCELCIEDKRIKLEWEEKERLQEEKIRLEREQWEKEQQERLNQPVIDYDCKECGFHCTNKYDYKNHFNDTKHLAYMRLKTTFCKECDTQCRTEAEYSKHCATAKHLKKIGEFVKKEEEVYTCEPCKYTTRIKCNYVIHLKTNKHQSCSSSSS